MVHSANINGPFCTKMTWLSGVEKCNRSRSTLGKKAVPHKILPSNCATNKQILLDTTVQLGQAAEKNTVVIELSERKRELLFTPWG